MATIELQREHSPTAELIRQADIVVGIPSYNGAKTIGHVVRAVSAGLAKYYPLFTAVIVNSDGAPGDKTRDEVVSAHGGNGHIILARTPPTPMHRFSLPYHGVLGKGSAIRLIFKISMELQSKACAIVDADLPSITPSWVDALLRPVLFAGYDLVAPYYHRHKYEGTITNSIVYPLMRSLYGIQVRQPIGGEFGFSPRLLSRYLKRCDWETDVADYGIDIWLTTIAVAEEFRVCQSFLGPKDRDAKSPTTDLSLMLQQLTGSVMSLMQEYEAVWQARSASQAVEVFGSRFDVGLDPVEVNTQRMGRTFSDACRNLEEVFALALQPETCRDVMDLGRDVRRGAGLGLRDELWARVILDFCCAYRRNSLEREQILGSLAALYVARTASFVDETGTLVAHEIEGRIEDLCLQFERLKPYLIAQWKGRAARVPAGGPQIAVANGRHQRRAGMEV